MKAAKFIVKAHFLAFTAVLLLATVLLSSGKLVARKKQVPDSMKWRNPSLTALEKHLGRGSKASADTTNEKGKRIVGGTPVTPGQYPWLASLRYRGESSRFDRQFCGGSLIGERTIFTAAHCTFLPESMLEVGLGEYDLATPFEADAELRNVRQALIHPRYSREAINFDFAIWTLTSKSFKTPATLVNPSLNLTYPGAMATIAGWGATSDPGYSSNILLQATIPIIDNDQCYPEFGDFVTGAMICAGYTEGGISTCFGDSGGPLFFMVDGSPVIVGDSSWVTTCAAPMAPAGFGRVMTALPFVDAVMNKKDYLTIRSVNIVYDYPTASLGSSTQVINLLTGRPVKGAIVTLTLASKSITGETSTYSTTGITPSSGIFGFWSPVTWAGTITVCVTSLSAPGYSNIDLSENCDSIELIEGK